MRIKLIIVCLFFTHIAIWGQIKDIYSPIRLSEVSTTEKKLVVAEQLEISNKGYKTDAKALKSYIKLASKTYQPNLFWYIGRFYENGWGTEKNIIEAIKWYEQGVTKNEMPTIMHLAYLYESGMENVDKDPYKAYTCYIKVADKQPLAAYRAGLYIEYVLGNLNEAVRYYGMALPHISDAESRCAWIMHRKGEIKVKKLPQQLNSSKEPLCLALSCYYGNQKKSYPILEKQFKEAIEEFHSNKDTAKYSPVAFAYGLSKMDKNKKFLKQSGALGSIDALLYLSDEILGQAYGVESVDVMRYLIDLDSLDCAEGQFALAAMYATGLGGKINLEKSRQICDRLFAKGFTPQGTKIDKVGFDSVAEIMVFINRREQADLGNLADQFWIGEKYEKYFGQNIAEELSKHYYELAAQQGHKEAAYRFAIRTEDIDKRNYYLQMASNVGHVKAQHELAMQTLRDNTSEDARNWEIKAAQGGVVEAQVNLAKWYLEGTHGFPKDYAEVNYWYKNYSGSKDINSSNYREVVFAEAVAMYEGGNGLNKNWDAADKLFREIAPDKKDAYYYLGEMALKEDRDEAKGYFEKCSNNEFAQARLNEIDKQEQKEAEEEERRLAAERAEEERRLAAEKAAEEQISGFLYNDSMRKKCLSLFKNKLGSLYNQKSDAAVKMQQDNLYLMESTQKVLLKGAKSVISGEVEEYDDKGSKEIVKLISQKKYNSAYILIYEFFLDSLYVELLRKI